MQPTRKLTLSVTGMTCQGCVATVQRALAQIPGVSYALVSLERGEAVVRALEGVQDRDLVAAVAAAGHFQASVTP